MSFEPFPYVTRLLHDQFAKSLLADFLAPLGRVEVGLEVTMNLMIKADANAVIVAKS